MRIVQSSTRASSTGSVESWCHAAAVRYRRMPIEVESPEQLGYSTITNNLAESSVADRRLADLGVDVDLDDLLLCYGDHLGDLELREAIASGANGVVAGDVLVTPGAAAALFCAATSLLDSGDHVIVVRTNYATNLETPRAIGADVDVVDLDFDDGWQLDIEKLTSRVRPGTTRLISITCPHNPTGTMLDIERLHALVELAERSGAVLLVDETYRDLTHGALLPTAASLSTRAISVSSMSKAYGLPGLRVGWAVCRDPMVMETLLAAKEQVLICGATLDEAIASRVLAARERILPPIRDGVRAHLEIVRGWLVGQSSFEWIEPTGGVVGLVRVRTGIELDTDRFYRVLLHEHGTYVGPGHWFEVDDRYFRLGFGWPGTAELRAGLAGLSAAAAYATVSRGMS
jgi:aspartate/methionine/tyrosine aminotransferase